MNILEEFKAKADKQIANLEQQIENNKKRQAHLESQIIKDLQSEGESREFCCYCGNDWPESWRGCCGEVHPDTEWFDDSWCYSETNGLEYIGE